MPSSWWKPEPVKDRTRFFISIAKTDGVPLAALCYYVAVCRVSETQPGCWTAKHLGRQIGLGHWRIRQMLEQAADPQVQLLLHERTTRGFRIWLHPVFAQWLRIKTRRPKFADTIKGFKSPLEHVHDVGFYRLSTAAKYGYTGSVLLELMDPEPREVDPLDEPEVPEKVKDKPQFITVTKACKLFIWMQSKTVRRALRKLVEAGWLECISTKLSRYRTITNDDFDSWREEVPERERGEEVYSLKKSRWTLPKKKKTVDKANRVRDKANRPGTKPIESGTKPTLDRPYMP